MHRKLSSIRVVAGLMVVLLAAAASRADSLLHLPQYAPMIKQITVSTLNYTYNGTTGIGTLTLLSTASSSGVLMMTETDTGHSYRTKLVLTAKFQVNDGSGALLGPVGPNAGSILDVWQNVDGLSSTGVGGFEAHQFQSAALYNFGFGLAADGHAGMYEFLWQKDSGTALQSDKPFIGAMVRMRSSASDMGNIAFNPAFASGDYRIPFTIAAIPDSKTDVFFTPTPSSVVGGLFLLSGVAVVAALRRRFGTCL